MAELAGEFGDDGGGVDGHRDGGEPEVEGAGTDGDFGAVVEAAAITEREPALGGAGVGEAEDGTVRGSEAGVGEDLEEVVAVLVADLLLDVVPGAGLEFVEVAFVFGVDDDGGGGVVDAEIGDEGALGAGEAGAPVEGVDGFAIAAGVEPAAGLAGGGGEDRFDPGFVERFHGHAPGDTVEIGGSGEAAVVGDPLDALDAVEEFRGAEGAVEPGSDVGWGRYVNGIGGDFLPEAAGVIEELVDEGAVFALGFEGAELFFEGEADGAEEVPVVTEVGEGAGDFGPAGGGEAGGGVGVPVDVAAWGGEVGAAHFEAAVLGFEQGVEAGEDHGGEDPGGDAAFGAAEQGEAEGGGADAPAHVGEHGADAAPGEAGLDEEAEVHAGGDGGEEGDGADGVAGVEAEGEVAAVEFAFDADVELFEEGAVALDEVAGEAGGGGIGIAGGDLEERRGGTFEDGVVLEFEGHLIGRGGPEEGEGWVAPWFYFAASHWR